MKLREGKVLLFDLESNGLLRHQLRPGETPVSLVHVLVVKDYNTKQRWVFRKNKREDTIPEGIAMLKSADWLAGHNIIGYDVPVLEHLYGLTFPKDKLVDTIVMSRLMYANMFDTDMVLVKKGILPGKLMGSHSLESWGYRTGTMKDEYGGDPAIEDPKERYERRWECWNQSMEDYCVQDVEATEAILDKCLNDAYYFPDVGGGWIGGIPAIWVEHRIKVIMTKQEMNGIPFDEAGAAKLYAELSGRRQALLDKLVKTFGSWWAPKGGTSPFLHPRTGMPLKKYPLVKYPKTGGLFLKDGKTLSKTPYFEGRPFTPIEHVQFNPGSRDHIGKVLQDSGWIPTEFTATGKPVVDEETLQGAAKWIKDPQKKAAVELIAEYMLVAKRLGQLSEGKQAWMSYSMDGMIYGSINPNGAVTGRATHSNPNLAQVPSSGAMYGEQCRALFGAAWFRKVWPEAIQVGTDQSGIELRCLSHFMARFDGGAYGEELVNGDAHWKNTIAFGLVPAGTLRDKMNKMHDEMRGFAKTIVYAMLYGSGAAPLGALVGEGAERGKLLKKNFMEATPALKALVDSLTEALVASAQWVNGKQEVKWRRKFIKGLDGRKVHIRSPHSALNALLQSAGAVCAKYWIITLIDKLDAMGLKHGTAKDDDYMLCAWVHDEVQIVCRNREIAEKVSAASLEAMPEVGVLLNFKCPLAAEAKIGDTWKDCH